MDLRRLAGALVIGVVGARAVWAGAPSGRVEADKILDATGVKGGLIVHLGCGDGALTAALRANESYLVQGLDTDAGKVSAARERIRALGLYGVVSARRWAGGRLPYVENLVNLVVGEDMAGISEKEVMRVLAPGGVAYIRAGDTWTRAVKPRPNQIDEWTHYLHDAGGNAVSRDTVVGPPRHLQWVGSPAWTRHHDNMSSFNAMVAAGGRVFYIMDEGLRAEIQLPSEWFVTARDAFNGTILWRRRIEDWHTQLWPAKSGPAQLPRRIVATGDTVYVTLGLTAPVTALDAATGRTLRTYGETAAAEEILVSDGTLFALVNPDNGKRPWSTRPAYGTINDLRQEVDAWAWDGSPRVIVAADAEGGRVRWTARGPVVPLTLAVGGGRVVYHDGEKVICLDRETGVALWRSMPVARAAEIRSWFAPTLVLHEDVVLFAGAEKMERHYGGKDTMTALSAKTGEVLWSAEHPPSGYDSPEDVLVIGGLVWTAPLTNKRDSGVYTGRDLRTGEVRRTIASDYGEAMPHHRCHRGKATERFLMPSRTGVEYVDLAGGRWSRNDWVRGACLYGLMPANGLTYAPPQSCACYILAKLNGLNALAPASPRRPWPGKPRELDEEGLERGPAYDEASIAGTPVPGPGDWPCYRHDGMRSGSTATPVPVALGGVWETVLGGKLSSPVIAGGQVFVAEVEGHSVCALDAGTGSLRWRFTACGRVDSPPTIWGDRVLFGSRDGFVYCLRAADGALVWRFRAAPAEDQLLAFEQVESVWPLHGSVLVNEGIVHAVAGRSMFVDGGMRYLRLDAARGKRLSETVLDNRDPKTGEPLDGAIKWPNLPTALPDILSCDGRRVYMRAQVFDLEGQRAEVVAPSDFRDQTGETAHLFCNTGFLDDSWWHRSLWLFGKTAMGGAGGWYQASYRTPTGRIMVFDGERVYSFDRQPQYFRGSTAVEYHLFAASKAPKILGGRDEPKANAKRRANQPPPSRPELDWSHQAPVLGRALVLAEKTIFMAGPPDVVDEERTLLELDGAETRRLLAEQGDAYAGKKGALLLAVSATDGKKLAAYRLASMPVFDGMAAACGRLYMAATDGKVICLGAGGRPLEEDAGVIFKEPDLDAARGRGAAAVTTGHPDFAHVARAAITACDLGWCVKAASGQVGFALKELPVPLTERAAFKFRLRLIPRDKSADPPRNGFFFFGDAPEEERLIKCGLRRNQGLIVQGPYAKAAGASREMAVKVGATSEVTVSVDLLGQKVGMTVDGQTLEAKLERPLKAIRFIGYGANSLSAEFSAIETSGQ